MSAVRPTNSKDGIRIASTLLKWFRERRGLTQTGLAERLGVVVYDVSACEQGDRSSDFINNYLGLIADTLNLTGAEILDLQSATSADEFLRRIRKPRKTEKARGLKARAFQSLMILPISETRRWLRIIFDENTLRGQVSEAAAKAVAGRLVVQKGKTVLDQDLVEPFVLREIRSSLREACEYAYRHDTPLDEISQMLLYWARSLAHLKRDPDNDRKIAVTTLEAGLAHLRRAPNRVVQRHLAHALYEIGSKDAMCQYLSETDDDDDDANNNIHYIARRSADSGNGMAVFDCTLRFLTSDAKRRLLPLCALDLRTIARVLATYRYPDADRGATALLNLDRTAALGQIVIGFTGRSQPDWSTSHACKNVEGRRCQDLADRYARRILAEIRTFLTGLRVMSSDFEDMIRACD